MRRFQIPNAALVAGLAALLSGCSGETPTAPSTGGGPGNGSGGGGSCTVLVSMSATTRFPSVGSGAIVRATVTRSGKPVPDGGSVQFSTDLGVFLDNGLNLTTISKTTIGGVADVTVFSNNGGTAHVKAVFDCQSAQIDLNFGGVPDTGPFISSIFPTTGSCVGGDTVTILGGRFGTDATNVTVTFGGVKGSIKGAVTDTQLTVTTPAHPQNPAVPETVNVVVRVNGLTSPPFLFTFTCNPQTFISSINPTEGVSAGGDVVQINGGGFGTNIATTRVTFCGRPATITAQADNQITVSTPASPADLEVCDVVVTRDLGLVSQHSATSPQQFTYRRVFTPVITSASPRTGPNDASTRVTIFGSGFQFPMQVFLTGGACGAQRVEAAVSDISLNTIVFKTPVAIGANVCLSSQLVDIVILNPSTGKTASCPACFKYYACPTITAIGPGFGPYTGGTQVIITGHNFEEPATVGGGTTAWQPISVSSEQIIAVTPQVNVSGCSDISSPVLVNGTSLNCPNAVGPIFTYYVKSVSPFIRRISPSSVPEGGAPGVVITGGNFFGNERVEVKLTPSVKVVPTSETPTTITFTAPPFTGSFNTVPCTTSGGAAGTRNVPTPVDVDVLNATTTCPSAVDQITYTSSDTTCKSGPLTITTTTLPNGNTTTAYSQTVLASGGTGSYSFSLSAGTLPAGLNLSASGTISGMPTTVETSTFTVTVNDGSTTVSRILSITISS
jgi:large repetitive protein